MDWDVFISHAWEDKESFARPLAEVLEDEGLRVWFDEFTLTVGDKLRRSIDHGLSNSKYGVVILSSHFFAKEWPQRELDGLLDREVSGKKVVLPIWHNVTADEVREYSHILADRIALSSDQGLEKVVSELLKVIRPSTPSPETQPALPSEPSLQPSTPFEPEMILVPAGEFLMGSDPQKDPDALDKEQPQHTLYLPDYYIAKTSVTNAEYSRFVRDTGHPPPSHWEGGAYPEELSDHPVVNVNWHDAVAYCQWLSENADREYRLPSEAEWEKAAGWDAKTGKHRIYPWGDHFDPDKCNTDEGGPGTTTPVGQYSPDGDSPYGVADMAGNVWEWTRSLWGVDPEQPDYTYPYDPEDGREDLEAEGARMLRGGSWYGFQYFVRVGDRYVGRPDSSSNYIGFRLVSPASPES